MSSETNHQGVIMGTAEMEKIMRNTASNRDTPLNAGYGFDFDPIGCAIGQVVQIIPVSYTGERQTVTVARPAVDRFMLDKPA